jgi:hypothetical protein
MDTQEPDLNNNISDNYKILYKRVLELRMQELFSEPYDGDMEEEE